MIRTAMNSVTSWSAWQAAWRTRRRIKYSYLLTLPSTR